MQLKEIILPAGVKRILKTLQEAGFPTYVVGGSVRDFLRGIKPHDWDICTSASPLQIKEIFEEKGYGIAPTGMNFGTVTVIDKRTPYEISVFKKRDEVLKNRAASTSKPYQALLDEAPVFNGLSSSNLLSVENLAGNMSRYLSLHAESDRLSSLASLTQIANPRGRFRPTPNIPYDDPRSGSALYEDLGLRDFTVNAVAWSPQEGYIDPYGGIQDIEDKVLRSPGLASDRIEEDPLRILRALRFASTLGYSVHRDLGETIHRTFEQLGRVTVERITGELYKFMDGPAVRVAALLREFTDVFCYLMPELKPMVGFDQQNHNHIFDVWEHTLKAMEACKLQDRIMKFTILFHDTGKPHVFTVDERNVGHFYGHAIVSCQICQQVTDRLKFDKDTAQKVHVLVEVHDARVEPNTVSVRHWINRLGQQQFERLLVMKRCDSAGQNPYYWPSREEYIHSLELSYRAVLDSGNLCFREKDLAIDGRDLIKSGYRADRYLGATLKRLLNEVLNEKVPNERKVLLKLAKDWLKQ